MSHCQWLLVLNLLINHHSQSSNLFWSISIGISFGISISISIGISIGIGISSAFFLANDMVIDEEEESPAAELAVIAPCPPDYIENPYASTCLQLHKEFISWYEAKAKCEARGETLAILPTDDDFKWYTELRKENESMSIGIVLLNYVISLYAYGYV